MSVGGFQKVTYSKEMVRQSFDSASQNYNEHTSLQRLIGDRLLLHKKAQNHANQSVLDIGAGTGYLTKKLFELNEVKDVYALDIAIGMLKHARHYLGTLQAKGVICADAEKLPLNDGVMDVIYSNLAFQWCENLEKVFAQAHRVLQPKGLFVFSTFGPATLTELKSSWQQSDKAVHVNSFVGEEVIRQALQRAGFYDITILTDNIVNYYSSPKQLMVSLKGMGAHNMNQGRRLGLTGVKSFKAMLKVYESLRTEQGVPATFQAVYVYAKKSE